MPKTKFTFTLSENVTKSKDLDTDLEVNVYTLKLKDPITKESTLIDRKTGLRFNVKNCTEAIIRENMLDALTKSGNLTMNEDGSLTYEGPCSEAFFDVTRAASIWNKDSNTWSVTPSRLIVTDISMADLSRRAAETGRARAADARNQALRDHLLRGGDENQPTE